MLGFKLFLQANISQLLQSKRGGWNILLQVRHFMCEPTFMRTLARQLSLHKTMHFPKGGSFFLFTYDLGKRIQDGFKISHIQSCGDSTRDKMTRGIAGCGGVGDAKIFIGSGKNGQN